MVGNLIKYSSRALHKDQFDSDIEKIRNYAVILQEFQAKLAEQTEVPNLTYPVIPGEWRTLDDVPTDIQVTDKDGSTYRYFDGEWHWGRHNTPLYGIDFNEYAPFTEVLETEPRRNEARQWPDWQTAHTDRAIEHVRRESR